MKLVGPAVSPAVSFNERLATQLATAGQALLEAAAILQGKPGAGFAPAGPRGSLQPSTWLMLRACADSLRGAGRGLNGKGWKESVKKGKAGMWAAVSALANAQRQALGYSTPTPGSCLDPHHLGPRRAAAPLRANFPRRSGQLPELSGPWPSQPACPRSDLVTCRDGAAERARQGFKEKS
jgi:hypothetical protein